MMPSSSSRPLGRRPDRWRRTASLASYVDPTSFTIDGVPCDGGGGENQPPTVTLTSPADGAGFEEGDPVPLAATASDPDGTINRVEFYVDGTLVSTDTSAPYSFSAGSIAVGPHTAFARAFDNGTPALSAESATVAFSVVAESGEQALIVTPTTVTVPENSTAIYTVRLATEPTSDVPVTSTAGGGDADITIAAGGTLIFTSSNWDDDQPVTLAAAEDADDTNGTRDITVSAAGITPVTVTATEMDDDAAQNAYITEFLVQYDKIKSAASGYFSPEGVPYHSIETLMVEAPDHGHETTSEAFSFWLWLEAEYGRVTGNWTPFNNAWTVMETYIIPTAGGQPGGQGSYNPSDPADYAPEFNQPSQYPVALDTSVVAGQDPLASELQSTYGDRLIYSMHWLLDVDDVYGFGIGRGPSLSECGDNTERVTYINTYQRGPQESVWETIPHPSCETGRFGQPGSGFPPAFIEGSGANQWRYTAAPDADARAVQAAYWALQWATEDGEQSQISGTLAKAAKMGDYLRYGFYDKYFKNPGCTSPNCPPGSGKSSSTGLLNWYYAWGGDIGGAWAWRIGSSHNHFGYQNPMAALALSPDGPTALRPLSPTADDDWAASLTRQIQFYYWLQSAEGAIAGGATNSWDGNYQQPPAGTPTFFGMAYDVDPVFHDPPSNQWFGFQVWSMHRVAEYYQETGDERVRPLLDDWVDWAISETTLGAGSDYAVPSEMSWSGAPAASFSSPSTLPGANPGLHVGVTSTSQDVGVAAAYARTLSYYAAATGDTAAKDTAKGLLDRMLLLKDGVGISVTEERDDYERFNDVWSAGTQKGLFVPTGFNGVMPNGDVVAPGSTFLSIRSFYEDDPAFPAVEAYMNGTGPVPTFDYHRFWAQADFAMALSDYGHLFPSG